MKNLSDKEKARLRRLQNMLSFHEGNATIERALRGQIKNLLTHT